MSGSASEAGLPAPAEKVWDRLTDWPAYGEWNTPHTAFPHGGPPTLAGRLKDSATAALNESLRKPAGMVG
ncbi:hypothetical protein ACWD0J_30275 [Streptomyces sp. NPDC003011]